MIEATRGFGRPSESQYRTASRLIITICVAVITVGVLDLVGWWLHMPRLVGLFAGYATMKPNTALLVFLLACSVLATRRGGRFAGASHLLCGLAVVLCMATLLEYSTGRNFGIDTLLANVPQQASGDPTGRMALGTALDGALLGGGLLVLDLLPVFGSLMTGSALLISLSALIGVLFGAGPLLGVPLLRSMAVRTGGSLFCLSLAFFLLRPEREPTRSLLHTVRFHRTGIWFLVATCTLPLVLGLPIATLYRTGRFDAAFSFASLVVLLIATQALLVSRNSYSLQVLEVRREGAEAERARIAEQNAEQYMELERSERRAAESEAQYRLITDALPAYIAYLDPELRYRHINRTYEQWFGHPAKEIEGRTVNEVLGDSAADVMGHLQAALGGKRQTFETRLTLGGQARTLSLSHIPEIAPDGTVLGVVVHGHDITARKEAEAALRESEERFRVLSEHSPLGIYQTDLQGRVTYVNSQVARTFNRPQEQLLRDGWLRFVHEEDAERVRDTWFRAVTEHSTYDAEYRIALEDGQIRHVHGRGTILLDEAGEPSSVVGTLDDVTARKLAEQALRQTEKLTAVGRLASSIAHEINNPLEAVTNLVYLARTSSEVSEIYSFLDAAEGELRRVSAIASQTLRFHKQATRPIAVEASEMLDNVLAIYGSRIDNAHIQVTQQHERSCSVICLDGEIRQVLNNLVGNAIDAMARSGGRLLLRSRAVRRVAGGEQGTIITIADTGTGMDAKTLRNLYEPFYTTKGMNGTGLGLWVSKEIVDRHQGWIRVRSSQKATSHGTVFRLFLPCEFKIS